MKHLVSLSLFSQLPWLKSLSEEKKDIGLHEMLNTIIVFLKEAVLYYFSLLVHFSVGLSFSIFNSFPTVHSGKCGKYPSVVIYLSR